MTASKNYAVFILTHGRPDRVVTYKTLRNCGYTGKIFLIVDDGDKRLAEYQENFPDEVIVFSKADYAGKFDIMDNFDGDKVIVFARNACYDIARKLGVDYFFEYEDDYTSFLHRYVKDGTLRSAPVKNLDGVLGAMIDCLEKTGSSTIAFAQGGDLIGGAGSFQNNLYKRKAMNSFVFKVSQDPAGDIIFIGRMNDDVNTYLTLGKTGALFFQISNVNLVQLTTQTNSGGNTEVYKEFGTYVKSFYSVIAAPSCCKIDMMGTTHKRLHHKINWGKAVPKILDEAYRKPRV